ncbi:hypothetical protein Tco_0315595 [Tanacetum coccineum]
MVTAQTLHVNKASDAESTLSRNLIITLCRNILVRGGSLFDIVKSNGCFNMGCNSDQNSLYSIPDTCDVPSLHRNEVDGDDEIDVTESMEDEEEEDEEEEDTY